MKIFMALLSTIFLYFRANLTPLIEETDELDLVLDICTSTNEKVGKLKVKVGWI